MYNDDSVQKLINSGKAFDGAGIPPRVAEGFRVKAIDNLQVAQQRDLLGGSEITLSFNQENTDAKSLYYVMAFVGSEYSQSSSNVRANALTSKKNMQGPYIIFGSPATIFVQSEVRTPCYITVTTRTPGGIVSELLSQPGVSTTINPQGSYFGSFTATHTLGFAQHGYISLDSGTYAVNLPDINQVIDGFECEVKNIGTGTITVTPAVSAQTIDGATTDVIATQYVAHRYLANTTTKVWYII